MIQGRQIIGFDYSADGDETFYSYNPAEQHNTNYLFHKATTGEINLAVDKAAAAFQIYRKKTGAEKAVFLTMLADELSNTGDELIKVCCEETGLPPIRIEGERMRTVNQVKMFAALLSEGSWVDARIDTGNPERTPLPKPDIRSMQIPLGPVVVFGASNFPLAFSVAGGDTISAFAAGCPVVVKAHPAHPATSAIIGKLIQTAAQKMNMPDGLFSLLFDNGINAGVHLVKHPGIKAVAFTGSYKAGKALFDIAVSRREPIPVYAEMGSTNPVFILPEAAKQRGQEIAAAYAASVTMGIGQFCTNPGLMIYQKQDDHFLQLLKTAFEKTTGGVMLTPKILDSYNSGVHQHLSTDGVEQLAVSKSSAGNSTNIAVPVLLQTSGQVINSNPVLSEEVFGPTGMAVLANSKKEMLEIAENLSGHLTATVHGTEEELIGYQQLLDVLEQKAGRVVINGFPTGVEVGNAMVHGGPYPSTTDSRTTSVGTASIYRFTRPVCYQNTPQQLLPRALQNKNVLKIHRLINGEWSTKDIS
ncbi:aldehyde dehydrogenase (NADP(+)) [Pseudoflavitalea rhizosphaerae]|uniref:aldehyde dehydrogenase (NADP(+)) n=1 Tax=Pseudoflavitalea rhizosphaerae TaxID=1884793 RepID=UPI000F8CB163|nr:aldehyde dehydrogenase (NADP(+)) [Pseudoflavitalea rhizosphaerae]